VTVIVLVGVCGGCRFDASGTSTDVPLAADGPSDGRHLQAESSLVDGAATEEARPPDAPLVDARRPDLPGPDLQARDARSPDARPRDLIPSDVRAGKWYQANQKHCPTYCSGVGLVNEPSIEGAYCASGEVRPKSAIDQGIDFHWGCWPDCTPHTGLFVAKSESGYCFMNGQVKDYDNTDRTVGCFCR